MNTDEGAPTATGELGSFLAAHVIFARYVFFAVIAGLSNLAAQEATVRIVPSWPVMVSVLVGTGIGFFVKYALEKKWIFFDDYDGHAAEIRKIVVYGLFGVGTTILFWGIELGALWIWQTTTAKYVGAAIGLSLGNWIKYLLDKHYVFRRKPA